MIFFSSSELYFYQRMQHLHDFPTCTFSDTNKEEPLSSKFWLFGNNLSRIEDPIFFFCILYKIEDWIKPWFFLHNFVPSLNRFVYLMIGIHQFIWILKSGRIWPWHIDTGQHVRANMLICGIYQSPLLFAFHISNKSNHQVRRCSFLSHPGEISIRRVPFSAQPGPDP